MNESMMMIMFQAISFRLRELRQRAADVAKKVDGAVEAK